MNENIRQPESCVLRFVQQCETAYEGSLGPMLATTVLQRAPYRDHERTPGLTCPWLLHWVEKLGAPFHALEGVLIMQDWGIPTPGWHIEDGVDSIAADIQKVNSGQKLTGDATTRRLLSCPPWYEAVRTGRWLVTNAVWGFRKDKPETGYLGSKIHAQSSRGWLHLIRACGERVGKPLNIVVAGSWAMINDNWSFPMPLPEFARGWEQWAARILRESAPLASIPIDAHGTVFRCDHPSIWRKRETYDPTEGPPAF